MEITELLDRAKSMANIESDYALAKVLGITAGNLSNIRKGRAHPSNEVAVKIATLAKLEEMRVIAEIEMRTANTEKKREFWKSYIDTKGLTATLGLIALGLSILATPEPAEASVLQMQNYGAYFHAHNARGIYIMRISDRPNPERFAVWFRVLHIPDYRRHPLSAAFAPGYIRIRSSEHLTPQAAGN